MRTTRSSVRALLLTAALLALGPGGALAGHEHGNVDELRFGVELDAGGMVPAKSHADHFVTGDAIHITMRIHEAREGTPVMVTILDRETDETVWSESQDVPGGYAVMHFEIDPGELNPAKYRAKVKLGEDWVAEHEFRIE